MTAPLEWRTATASGAGDCVEIGWRTATASTSGDCVEVGCARTRPAPRIVHVRDSKDPDGPRLTLTPAAWVGLVKTIKEGR